MDFTNILDKTKKTPIWLALRSIIVLSGEARYKWLDGIAPRKSDDKHYVAWGLGFTVSLDKTGLLKDATAIIIDRYQL